ncbi:MAG TPA: FAD-dependent oxidoreductase [Spirochaetia bacterium]|nr:FAD-dependent oxidoreductase [Spirochaetia bacterium]
MSTERTERIEITFDGKKLLVDPGATILEVAEAQGVGIPTLCNDRRLSPYASCWVCLVKVDKARGFVPSCGTRVLPGMVISTQAPEVKAARKTALELILSSHYGDCKAPCTLTCPSNIDIQGYLGLVANGKATEALDLIRRDNPMPAVIGRICPRPCEQKCRRRLVEEPLNINGIKRFVADAEAQAGGMPARPRPKGIGKRAAIIGAGPAGLSAAWFLSEKGVEVTLYEAMDKAGGMLRYGIPDYRLPPAVLDQTIADMLSMGAVLKTGVRLGADVMLERLRKENDAVVIAIGAWKGRTLRIPGEDHPAVLSGIDFLRDVNAGRTVRVGKRVAIVGGGNTALDAARCSLRHGAAEVTMYYRRTREEMPASDAEIEEAIEEGIEIRYLAAPVSIQTDGQALKSLTLLEMELGEPDASGRRRPVPVEGSEFSVPVDTIISAVGQHSETKLLSGLEGLVDSKGNVAADIETGATAVPGVFVAGDLLTGTDIAIRAIAGGKHAARAVLAYFEGRKYTLPKEFLSKKADFKDPAESDFKDTPRAGREKPRVLDPLTRKKSFVEIESTLTAAQAVQEAARCLECGCQDVLDCALKQYATEYEATATRFRGDIPIHPVDDSHPLIARDPSKCVLCGRCVRICLEVQGIGVFGYVNRGFSSIVAPSFGVPFGQDASCISCGQCVSACPVGALTEKLPAPKTVPLPERVENGICSLCSVGCAIEYRWHGSLFTRVTERYTAPNNGKLCKKGKFGHDFLNSTEPSRVDPAAARAAVAKMLEDARSPLMRISGRLSGEAIDAFLEAAARKRIPVVAEGLEGLDPRWADLESEAPASRNGAKPIRILVGDIGASNNVAFTEALRLYRLGLIDLWLACHDDAVARRTVSRIHADLAPALTEATSSGSPVEIVVNPEEAPPGTLEALLAVRARVRVSLLWSSRNAGYLFRRTATLRRPARKPDLLLDVGVESGVNGTARIAWGMTPGKQEFFIPLARELWIRGRCHPTGGESIQAGAIAPEALADALVL